MIPKSKPIAEVLPNQTMADYAEKNLVLLNKHFKTVPFEKHPKAMLHLLFERGCHKVLGKDFRKQRISQRKQEKLYLYMIERLKSCYGKWVTISHFSEKNGNIRFSCNLSLAFKNEKGILYKSMQNQSIEDLFFTSHIFERFEERLPVEQFIVVATFIKKYRKYHSLAEIMSSDILFIFAGISHREYARYNEFIYLNIQIGVLVLEDFQDFFVVKTFLTYEMAKKLPLRWVAPLFDDPKIAKKPYLFSDNFRDILNLDTVNIIEPSAFFQEDNKYPENVFECESDFCPV
jgi:hypothetical protein